MTLQRSIAFSSLVLGAFLAANAQVDQIDRAKLPSDPAVQAAYADLLPIDQFARTYEASWRFPTPKAEIALHFTGDLRTLEEAQKKAPGNQELQLLTGLVAHLAYNLDIEAGYDPAMNLLGALVRDDGSDYRPLWFLGIHQCQSNNTVGGMRHLLQVESTFTNLPRAFWQDYANCAGVSFMPEHAVRAYDNARKISNGPATDEVLEQLARNRIKPSKPSVTYPIRAAWAFDQTKDQVRFTSQLCGESLATQPDAHLNLNDVKNGTCAVTIESAYFQTGMARVQLRCCSLRNPPDPASHSKTSNIAF